LGHWFDQHRFAEIFWLVGLMPLVGVSLWLWLSAGTQTKSASNAPHPVP
jgi:hypothetical protein